MTSEDRNLVPQSNDERSAEPVIEMLPAYALGVLDDEDRVRVETELARSAILRNELHRVQSTVDTLNLAVPEAIPDSGLADRIMASTAPDTNPVGISDRRSLVLKALASAAAILIVILGAALAVQTMNLRESEDQVAALQSDDTDRRASDFVQPLVWTKIVAEDTGSGGWGYFCRTEDGSVGWIVVEGMHAVEDRVFQLWLVDGDEMVSAGMFATDQEGRGFGVVRADAPVHSFREIWITLEPPGGSPAPSSEPDVAVPIV